MPNRYENLRERARHAVVLDGKDVRYVVEWGSATQLGASGVTQATLRPGDYVVVNGNPGRNPEDNRVRLLNFLRPSDGLTWGLRPDEVFD